jgi:hypothetical protein
LEEQDLIDMNKKHKLRVLTEEKLDDIGARLISVLSKEKLDDMGPDLNMHLESH